MLDLVIFDCDGVLVDTEEPANRLLVEMLAADGYEVDYAECRHRFLGKSLQSIQAMVEQALDRSIGEDWQQRVHERTLERFAQGIRAVPGVEALLKRLDALGLPYCVASSGRADKMRFTLGHCGLLPYLEDVLFSADEVQRGKPAPDLFVHAAARMRASPERCVLIEDSPYGVQGGVAAGMRVIGYAGDPLTDDVVLRAAGAEVARSMDEVAALLGLPPP
jgi:HAD superfamily hydrolase (TIGR01509 family)